MLLTITTNHPPATDLGYLLAKHPSRCQTFDLAYGRAHVFYILAEEERCTACLLLDLDPVGLVRGRKPLDPNGTLAQYVNDRPYVASSFLSVAIAQVFGSALRGSSKARPQLAASPIPLEATVSVVPCRGGHGVLGRLFAPLGYEVQAERIALDEKFPGWGESPYYRLSLRSTRTLSELLTHLYVLLPVLDNQKHYWVGRDELEKLLERGKGWLERHPAREEIARRYLKYRPALSREAIERLLADETLDPDAADEARELEEARLERRITLNEERMGTVVAVLKELGAARVLDLGCGEGRLLELLLKDPGFRKITGVDVSLRALEVALRRLKLERLSEQKRERIELLQGSLTYRDARFSDYDALCLVEVVEHVDPSRLRSLETVVFTHARPRHVLVTTPNADYNVRFEGMAQGAKRHRDHRFEWSRDEFARWAGRVAGEGGYAVRFLPIGPVDAELGPATQMAVFSR
jgi:3' terminal RNA ribose 2'-O-methyltransferase Hen1